jgi:biopolymer transport protein ExbD
MASLASPEVRPEMNVVPLIDVLLVLLVMFIITIPMQSHAVQLDLPGPMPPTTEINPIRNTVEITRHGVILWNRAPVSQNALAHSLARSLRLPREPELHIRPDAYAPYVVVDEVLATSKRVGVTKLGFVGNEAHLHAF